MTVSTTTTRTTYTGNGSTTAFATGFSYLDDEDVVVTLTVAGVDTVQTLSTHYTIAKSTPGAAASPGTVTMLAAPASGSTVTIERVVSFTQELAFRTQGNFSPLLHEIGFDKLTMQLQQIDSGSDAITDDVDTARDEFAAADDVVRAEFAAADNVVRDEFALADASLQSQIDLLTVGGGPSVTNTPTALSVPLANGSGKIQDGWLSSNIVTLTGSQTLTNKTLTSPSVAVPIISGGMTVAGGAAVTGASGATAATVTATGTNAAGLVVSSTGTASGIEGSSPTGTGIYGHTPGNNPGVYGLNQGAGRGVQGISTNDTGGHFETNNGAYAVYGVSNTAGGGHGARFIGSGAICGVRGDGGSGGGQGGYFLGGGTGVGVLAQNGAGTGSGKVAIESNGEIHMLGTDFPNNTAIANTLTRSNIVKVQGRVAAGAIQVTRGFNCETNLGVPDDTTLRVYIGSNMAGTDYTVLLTVHTYGTEGVFASYLTTAVDYFDVSFFGGVSGSSFPPDPDQEDFDFSFLVIGDN